MKKFVYAVKGHNSVAQCRDEFLDKLIQANIQKLNLISQTVLEFVDNSESKKQEIISEFKK